MTEHELKCVRSAFLAVKSGAKKFEVRLNDRFYQPGDIVVLRCLSNITTGYDSFETPIRKRVGWLLQGGQFGIEPRYCVFSLDEE